MSIIDFNYRVFMDEIERVFGEGDNEFDAGKMLVALAPLRGCFSSISDWRSFLIMKKFHTDTIGNYIWNPDSVIVVDFLLEHDLRPILYIIADSLYGFNNNVLRQVVGSEYFPPSADETDDVGTEMILNSLEYGFKSCGSDIPEFVAGVIGNGTDANASFLNISKFLRTPALRNLCGLTDDEFIKIGTMNGFPKAILKKKMKI